MSPEFREAGLPKLVSDVGAPTNALVLAKGVVRAVYPDQWRVDIEAEDGGIIHKAQVIGPHFPPVHKDLERPSHVYFLHAYGNAVDAACFPLTFRRMLDAERTLEAAQGKNAHSQKARGDLASSQGEREEPHRHYHHLHVYCQRAGDITVRITDENQWIIESEAGDCIRYDQNRREVDVLAPTVRIGAMEQTRVEYVRGEHLHIVSPEILLGTPDSDQQVILGNLWKEFYNVFIRLFNQHRHLQVQPGGGISGFPQQKAEEMSDDLLSDITKTQKAFPHEEYS
jgi:hypothetical protein